MADEDEFVVIILPDTYGVARGVLVSKPFYEKQKLSGIAIDNTSTNFVLPNSTLVETLRKDGFPDGYAYPTESTCRRHHEHNDTSLVFCEYRCKPNDSSSDYIPSCSRGVLLKALEKLESLGLSIYGAFEYEFYLYKVDENNSFQEILERRTLMDISVMKDYLSFTKDVMKTMRKYGIVPEHHALEYGKGQFEITMAPDYGITIADNAMRFKGLVKEVAKKHGFHASFISNPFKNGVSSSAHLNHSIWDNSSGENKLFDGTKDDNLSEFFHYWLAGLQHHAKALTCLTASTVGCYKRLEQPYTPKNDSWGILNRLACFRVKNFDKNRTYIENRIPGASTNPYLSLAALIYAGIDGITKKLPLKNTRCVGDLAAKSGNDTDLTELPKNMEEGIKDLLDDETMCNNIGKPFIDCFVEIRKAEMEGYKNAVKCQKEVIWYQDNYVNTL